MDTPRAVITGATYSEIDLRARRQLLMSALVIKHPQPELFQMVLALRPPRGRPGIHDGRHDERDEDRDDGDGHEQLDEGEATTSGVAFSDRFHRLHHSTLATASQTFRTSDSIRQTLQSPLPHG